MGAATTLTFDGLMAVVAEQRPGREEGDTAERRRAGLVTLIAVKQAEALLALPPGWTVTRGETEGMSTRGTQTQFSLYDDGFRERAYVRCVVDGEGVPYVWAGATVGRMFDSGEARGWAVLLLLASLECEVCQRPISADMDTP